MGILVGVNELGPGVYFLLCGITASWSKLLPVCRWNLRNGVGNRNGGKIKLVYGLCVLDYRHWLGGQRTCLWPGWCYDNSNFMWIGRYAMWAVYLASEKAAVSNPYSKTTCQNTCFQVCILNIDKQLSDSWVLNISHLQYNYIQVPFGYLGRQYCKIMQSLSTLSK